MRRTTLALDERLLERVRDKARREGRKLQECVNELLALGLQAQEGNDRESVPLPVFDLGQARVDIADRDALYELMEGADEPGH